VREAFIENFTRRREVGATCCVYHKGEKVVDLWGGVRNKATGEPWQEDTMALVYSATKGLAAMTLAVAHSCGWLDYDELVSKYWPEFAQNGKEKITVRQLLAHQAGLFALYASTELVELDLYKLEPECWWASELFSSRLRLDQRKSLSRKMTSSEPIGPAASKPRSSVIPRETAAQKPINDHPKGIGKR
jgi:CubicO group peptidase (beta-lactamase class C family)